MAAAAFTGHENQGGVGKGGHYLCIMPSAAHHGFGADASVVSFLGNKVLQTLREPGRLRVQTCGESIR